MEEGKNKKRWEMAVLMILVMTVHDIGTIADKPGHRDNVTNVTRRVPVKPRRLERLVV